MQRNIFNADIQGNFKRDLRKHLMKIQLYKRAVPDQRL